MAQTPQEFESGLSPLSGDDYRTKPWRPLLRPKRIGVKEEEHNLRNNVARGKFAAAFFLQCLSAIGVQTLQLVEG